ncbi:eukaryotic initiation factor-2B gamma subunit, putative [Eimeria tenella]|uniref:Translation initiation factor eIF2B subunit gamma n=1 Tax=Eimeria tenella TaxID=5802 RepID=U6KN53_EIMTE|nr:eukaryotic initiation factor-2B gamma subunit, putative [Eimeria tenella]CDJ39527.1 eukaryotic initiation factor-2B gamma subunit, putative [Eimeria tenella]|eukprot:XP_013230282.1 eukaryotic initiation factor-2B gamma subunit, putative [Eimeria tenella]
MSPHTADAAGAAAPSDAPQQKNPFPEFQVVVLAGGSGSRLSSLLDAHGSAGAVSCKALLPVANRPMIWYCLRNLQEATFGDVIVVTQAQQQAELSAYLQQEFRSSFRRLEVVGLKCTRRGEEEDGEDGVSGVNRRRSVDITDDPEQRVCGTAEALQQIRHLITTDFIVLSCDLIGHVDFFALANRHRAEGAACTVYLMPRDPFAEETSVQPRVKGGGKKSKEALQEKSDTSRGNPVTVVVDDAGVQLLAIQDRHSMSHGSSLQIPKLHLFLYPSQHLLPHYYDPHVYVFTHATLKIFDQPSLRHSLYSIRFDLVPYMTTMQMTSAAEVWSNSRLECDIFEQKLWAIQHQGEEESTSTSQTATAPTNEMPTGSGLPVHYTAANPPPRPAKGNRVVCCIHPEAAGICCRVNNLADYREMNNKFCCGRLDELRAVLPDWALPEHNPKKPGSMRDCVLADGATLEADVVVKRSVVAKNASLRSGCKVTQSILMTGTEVGQKAVLQRVILCPGAKVGRDCKLVNCQVRGGFCVPDGTNAEDTTLPSFTDGVDFSALHL